MRNRDDRLRPAILGMAVLAVAGLIGPVAASRAGEKPELSPKEAAELFQALQQVRQAVAADQKQAPKPVEVKVQRPAKTVTRPTMTPSELDRLVSQYLTKNDPKVAPAPITTDVEFVRRAYFDLIGQPPTVEQFIGFLRDRSPEKRARLIDRLLADPGWSRNWARYWRDVIKFHATNENYGQIRFDMLEEWLGGQLKANRPWDEIVRAMITATGRNDEPGPVPFPLAYAAQPVEMAGEVSRIFLGVQIQCAQCHDHKTDSWKREQFHEFAAFFAGGQVRRLDKGGMGKPAVFSIEPRRRAQYTMPDMKTPTKQIPMPPRFFLTAAGSKAADPALPVDLSPDQRRELVASYITGQDNPWFARAFVNRTWYALMGEAFYEPIDDMGPERTARASEVLFPLADQWQRGGYDIRWLYRTILNTQAYQRRVRSTANSAGRTAFAAGCPSRLRSDQIFTSLQQALGLPSDDDDGASLADRQGPKSNEKKGDPKKASGKKAVAAAGLPAPAKKGAGPRRGGLRAAFDRLFGVDPSLSNDEILGTIPQALFMMNGQLINNRVSARSGTLLGQILATSPNDRAALEVLYLRILSRQPTAREVEVCGRYIQTVGDRSEAFEDIYWSLINSTEFATRR